MCHLRRARRVPAPEYQVNQETRAVPPSNQARRLVPARRQTSIIRRFSHRTRQTSKACQETRAARLLSSRLASNRGAKLPYRDGPWHLWVSPPQGPSFSIRLGHYRSNSGTKFLTRRAYFLHHAQQIGVLSAHRAPSRTGRGGPPQFIRFGGSSLAKTLM